MKLSIDSSTDTLYFKLHEAKIKDSEEVREGIIFDYDELDNLVGIEILKASKHMTTEELKRLQFETV